MGPTNRILLLRAQSSEPLTTAHPSQSIPAVASCAPSANRVHTQQQESASLSDPLTLPVAYDAHDLNVADNPAVTVPPGAPALEAGNFRRSARRSVPSTRADLANSIGGNAHAVQVSTTAIKKRGNTGPGNHRGAK